MLGNMFIILLLYDPCPCVELPTHLYLLQPLGVRVAGLIQFMSDPAVGIPGRVWSLPPCPCLGPQVGSNGGSCCWNLWLCSPCWGKVVLGAIGGAGAPSAKKWTSSAGRSSSAPSSSSISNQTCFLGFSSFCGEASCQCTQFLCSNLRPSREQWSCLSGWGYVGLGDITWLRYKG